MLTVMREFDVPPVGATSPPVQFVVVAKSVSVVPFQVYVVGDAAVALLTETSTVEAKNKWRRRKVGFMGIVAIYYMNRRVNQ